MSDRFHIRAALPGDRAAMREITRSVWEGSDYVPLVWDRWLEDRHGLLQVAVRAGRMVGFQHVTIQPDGGAWLEGIRVAESERGTGAGRALLKAGLRYARLMGCDVVRLSTASVNPASTRLAESAGFRPVARFRPVSALDRAGGAAEGVRLAQGSDLDDAFALAASQEQQQEGAGFYTEGWIALRLTRERLRLLLNIHAVAVIGRRPIAAMAIATCREPYRVLRLGFLAGSQEEMTALCRWLVWRAATTGTGPLQGTVLDGLAAVAAQAAGLRAAAEMDMVLYEREPAGGPSAEEG